MGNWRTVDMKGRIAREDVADICSFLSDCEGCGDAWCFTMGLSLCGLGRWVGEDGNIDVSANLYERDFDNDDIETALKILAERYPSLELTLHSGSDWESTVCSATFHVHNGTVERCDPEVETIRECRCISLDEYFRQERLYGK